MGNPSSASVTQKPDGDFPYRGIARGDDMYQLIGIRDSYRQDQATQHGSLPSSRRTMHENRITAWFRQRLDGSVDRHLLRLIERPINAGYTNYSQNGIIYIAELKVGRSPGLTQQYARSPQLDGDESRSFQLVLAVLAGGYDPLAAPYGRHHKVLRKSDIRRRWKRS
jgi:hypothetical protein